MLKKGLTITMFFCVCSAPSYSQEFRTFNPVPTPGKMPKGAVPVTQVQPLSHEKTASAVQEVFDAWNRGDMERYLGNEFYDKTRLTDALTTKDQKDATVRVLSTQGSQTINQIQRRSDNGKTEIISTVSVRANTQIEFNDPGKGFRKLEGTNEYIMRITEEIAP